MKKIISLILVISLVLCSAFAVPNNRNAAATVNLIRNTVITNADLANQMSALGATSDDQALSVLNIMINDEVFLQGAERDGITVTDAQLDALYAQQKSSYESQAGGTLTDEQFEQVVILLMLTRSQSRTSTFFRHTCFRRKERNSTGVITHQLQLTLRISTEGTQPISLRLKT